MRTILVLSLTKPLRTKWSLPARRALAATINHVTLPIILTLAGLLAVLAIGPVWALFLTLKKLNVNLNSIFLFSAIKESII